MYKIRTCSIPWCALDCLRISRIRTRLLVVCAINQACMRFTDPHLEQQQLPIRIKYVHAQYFDVLFVHKSYTYTLLCCAINQARLKQQQLSIIIFCFYY